MAMCSNAQTTLITAQRVPIRDAVVGSIVRHSAHRHGAGERRGRPKTMKPVEANIEYQ